ncbi:hypothetical protein [Marinoscillum luteum]|uniref:Energy transducer TonB n=1 Tax=Marinoscillum luteum TaxID=861051 RepID=A0ABW7N734_9BACT
MGEEKEKKYRKIGWFTSILVQVIMLILFYFLIAWKEPFPPIPSYGIELSFGIEDAGSGEKPLSNPTPTEEPEEEVEEVSADESVNEPLEETAEFQDEVLEEITEPTEAPLVETPSPDVVEKKTETPKVEKPKEGVKEVKPAKTQPKEAEKVTKETLNPAATMPKTEGDPNSTKGEQKEKGAEGKEEGSIDGRALMGEQGSSNGASLQMAGWVWDVKPNPKDASSESGKIVYRIKVDSDGYLTGIELVSSTVSHVVERYYRQSVERLSFTKTNDYSPAPISSGTITFIIRSK